MANVGASNDEVKGNILFVLNGTIHRWHEMTAVGFYSATFHVGRFDPPLHASLLTPRDTEE